MSDNEQSNKSIWLAIALAMITSITSVTTTIISNNKVEVTAEKSAHNLNEIAKSLEIIDRRSLITMFALDKVQFELGQKRLAELERSIEKKDMANLTTTTKKNKKVKSDKEDKIVVKKEKKLSQIIDEKMNLKNISPVDIDKLSYNQTDGEFIEKLKQYSDCKSSEHVDCDLNKSKLLEDLKNHKTIETVNIIEGVLNISRQD